jgi:hypothetical protein
LLKLHVVFLRRVDASAEGRKPVRFLGGKNQLKDTECGVTIRECPAFRKQRVSHLGPSQRLGMRHGGDAILGANGGANRVRRESRIS